jgi:hypothetical protein
MPALKNPRHEQFAQMIVLGTKNGWTQGAAYSRSGYKAEGQAAETNASRLLKNAQIQARLAELAEPVAKRTQDHDRKIDRRS